MSFYMKVNKNILTFFTQEALGQIYSQKLQDDLIDYRFS